MNGLPPEVVLDASCVVKWFTEEENTNHALHLLELHRTAQTTLYAPDLLVYEVLNALRFKPNINTDTIKTWSRDLLDLQLTLIPPTTDLVQHAVELALQYSTTIYDSVYLALAENLGVKLVTADIHFTGKINQPDRIILLKNLFQ
ncbi:MAG: type II toxin-antitoxin system VapC family toxin [Candidatus Ranarchaeia archaeon]